MSILPSSDITLKNEQRLIIGSAKKKDAKQLIAYLQAVVTESDNLTRGMGEFLIKPDEEKIIIESHAATSNKLFLTGKVENKIVSVLTCGVSEKPRLKHIGTIGITVRKDFWDIGIGSAMMRVFTQWAKENSSLRKIELAVRTDNKNAIKLYKKFGFVREGTIKRALCIDGLFYDNYVMGLTI